MVGLEWSVAAAPSMLRHASLSKIKMLYTLRHVPRWQVKRQLDCACNSAYFTPSLPCTCLLEFQREGGREGEGVGRNGGIERWTTFPDRPMIYGQAVTGHRAALPKPDLSRDPFQLLTTRGTVQQAKRLHVGWSTLTQGQLI
jgi:hypothetical protein